MRFSKKIFLSILCLSAFLISALSGCATTKYNAVLYDQAIDFDWLTDEYLSGNLIRNMTDEPKTYYNENYPINRVSVINTKDEFDIAFKYFPEEVDFDKQMLVLYFYLTHNAIYVSKNEKKIDFKCKQIEVEDGNLSIEVSVRYLYKSWRESLEPDAMAPNRRCIIIKMDKVEYETIKVSLHFR